MTLLKYHCFQSCFTGYCFKFSDFQPLNLKSRRKEECGSSLYCSEMIYLKFVAICNDGIDGDDVGNEKEENFDIYDNHNF